MIRVTTVTKVPQNRDATARSWSIQPFLHWPGAPTQAVGDAVGVTAVAVGGAGVPVGATAVAVGGADVAVGARGVPVAGGVDVPIGSAVGVSVGTALVAVVVGTNGVAVASVGQLSGLAGTLRISIVALLRSVSAELPIRLPTSGVIGV